jgi:Raf kinase inhibitor-like YbhB/YbcL family protein
LQIAAVLALPLAIPIAVAAVAPDLSPFSASFPGERTLDRPAGTVPPAAQAFAPFQKRLGVSWDADYFYIEGNGLPDHQMMVGITAWQQQVPLPQPYTGDNAWRVPLKPVPAEEPAMIEGRFLRGAIAIAVNGIPIFNPQNNRGEVSYEIGELDQWGGHCGRADDYHYHIAPVHLESLVGKGKPVAYALDGYPVLGLSEADGSAPKGLDECHGHDHDGLGYHYHAAEKYPYVLGGFHGEVVEAEGQVDPQPRAQGVREALQALRGAEITGFEKTGGNAYQLSYSVDGDPRAVRYRIGEDGTFPFEFDNGRDGKTSEVYRVRGGGGGGGGGRPPRRGGGEMERRETGRMRAPGSRSSASWARNSVEGFALTSEEIGEDGRLPAEFTGDGAGVSPPLSWQGAPAGTKRFALIMDHLAPGGEMKSYWVMWDIPADTTRLPKDASEIGRVGVGFRGEVGYEPPHSQGPGDKTYTLHLYALSGEVDLAESSDRVSREALLEAMEGKILGQADLSVVYARPEGTTGGPRGGKGGPRP